MSAAVETLRALAANRRQMGAGDVRRFMAGEDARLPLAIRNFRQAREYETEASEIEAGQAALRFLGLLSMQSKGGRR